ncbi:hypothetical protein CAAN1_02S01134 [[Candida] anglica]|uniref:Dienelactone hydrolase domain-containing protein n=1 Tax=[Candida] anglica TaxID=148631 RepID=A0ABP0E7W9_9ASCO
MASKQLGPCCFKSINHIGTPIGLFKDVYGLNTYQIGEQYGTEKVIVFLTDVFGHQYMNNCLVADRLSEKAKALVLVPDILQNDPISSKTDLFNRYEKWLVAHGVEKTSNIVQGFLSRLRSETKTKYVFGIGHCFGARYVVRNLSDSGLFDSGAIAHPANVSIEEVESVVSPILISTAAVDPYFSDILREKTIEILTRNEVWYQLTIFQGVDHGFAARGNPNDKKVVYSQGKVISDQIEFFSINLLQ